MENIQHTAGRPWVRPLVLFLVAVLLLGATYVGGFLLFPLQASELSTRWKLRLSGVREIQAGGVHAYLRDHCGGQAEGCACVALIHGLGDSALTWKNLLVAERGAFDRPVRLLAPDLPGTGASAPPGDSAGYRVRKQAEALRRGVLTQCPRWIVVGNSMGGWIGAWVALDWPEGVERLVLVDAAGLREEVSMEDVRRGFVEPTAESLREFSWRVYHRPRKLPERVWAAAAARMRAGNVRDIVRAQQPEDFLDEQLPRLRAPTQILWGASDRLTPVAAGVRMSALISGARFTEVPACGHLPQKECPKEVFRAVNGALAPRH